MPTSPPDLVRLRAADAPAATSPEPGLRRRILVHNPNLMLVEHRMEKGWSGARHGHPQDQLVYILSGRLTFTCGGESFEAVAGDSFIVRGGVEHEAAALEDCVVIDVFHPTRPEYVPLPPSPSGRGSG
jgi:quercetin dioxygenase-like cupin family protein